MRSPRSFIASLSPRVLALLLALSPFAVAAPAHALVPGEVPSHSRWIRQQCVRPKDFVIVKIGGYYHIYAIKSDSTTSSENTFLHQRSLGNPQTWEALPDEPLSSPPRTGWDANNIWAPSIVQRNGTDYMFYTGVNSSAVQEIGLQTATNLTLPTPWSASGISNPLLSAPGSPFVASSKQLRDPFVFRNPNGSNWLMLYTSSRSTNSDHEGIGLATSGPDTPGDPLPGPWSPGTELVTDSTVYGSPDPARGGAFKTESSHLFQHGARSYVLFSSDCDPNESTYGACTGLAGGNIRILVNEDPALPTNGWQYKGTLSKLLGFNSSLWYASEYVKDPDTGEEYLAAVRQSEQNASTQVCPEGQADSSVIELHRIVWDVDPANPWKFGLTDPNPPGFWTQQNVGGPTAREQTGVALDTRRHLLWYVGGTDGSTKNDVYTFPLTLTPFWSVRTPSSGPTLPTRRDPGVVYDPVGDRLIVYGGFASTSILNPLTDLWQLTGLGGFTQWAAMTPDSLSSAPSNLVYGSQTVFDPVRNRMIVVDGQGRAWALNLPSSGNPYWQVLQASGGLINAGGLYFNLVYDSKHDRLLAFGGWLASFYPPYDSMNGVYAFPLSGQGANTWAAITTTGTPPSRRSLAAAVYDARRDRLVVFGGQAPGDVSGTVYANEWQLSYGSNGNTGTWTQLSAPGTVPAARGGPVAAYDSTEDRMVCFGGRTGASAWSNEQWSSSWGAGAPWQVTDLSPTVHCTSIDFAWTDPRDDKADGSDDPNDTDNPHFGPGVFYDIRSYTQPLTNANWGSGTSVLTGTPSSPGSAELVNVSVGSCSARRYYAVRVSDETGGLSWVSNSTGNIGTPCPHGHQICIDDEFAKGTPREAGLELIGEQPAHGAVTLSYSVPASVVGSPYDLSIYDVSGRRVLDLERGTAAAGTHNVVWNPQSDRGVKVRAGVYFVRLRLASQFFNRTVVVLGP